MVPEDKNVVTHVKKELNEKKEEYLIRRKLASIESAGNSYQRFLTHHRRITAGCHNYWCGTNHFVQRFNK
jgi:hypothetical protein